MGRGYTFRCRKCGYEISAGLGVGFMFPMVHERIMKAAREGKYGRKIQRFLEKHPDGVLNTENVLLRCTACYELECGPELSMYVRRRGALAEKHGTWSLAAPFEGADYVSPMELSNEKAYKFVARGHICRKCGRIMKPAFSQRDLEEQMLKDGDDQGRTEIPCPKCREPLWMESGLMWD